MTHFTCRGPQVHASLFKLLIRLTTATVALIVDLNGSARAQVTTPPNPIADVVTATVFVGTEPVAVAVNEVTNRIYVANAGSNSVSVIEGATNQVSTIPVGTRPMAIAVNTATNRIFVLNKVSHDLTIINGATGAIATVALTGAPEMLAVNPVTNKAYIGDPASQIVQVVDVASLTVTPVDGGAQVLALAVNKTTNKLYIAICCSQVAVLSGATNQFTLVTAGNVPNAIGINESTNLIYVANSVSRDFTIIDGATNASSNHSMGTFELQASAVAANPVTGKVYFVGEFVSQAVIFDPAADKVTSIQTFEGGKSLAINTVTNAVYVANRGSTGLAGKASIITSSADFGFDYAYNLPTIMFSPQAVAVNAVTNKAYMVDPQVGRVYVISKNKATSVLQITSSSNPSTVGQTVVFTASVAGNSPVGTMRFRLDSNPVAGCDAVPVINGSASCPVSGLTNGIRTISADYSGDADNTPASLQVSQTVNLTFQTIGFGTVPPQTYSVGAQFTVTAAASSGLGLTFDIYNGACSIANATSNSATVNVTHAGTCTIRARQAGNTVYISAQQLLDVVIARAPQIISYAPPGNLPANASPFSLTSAQTSAGLFVSFASSTPAICTVGGSNARTVTLVGISGLCFIVVSQSGSIDYLPATDVTVSFLVTPSAPRAPVVLSVFPGDAALTVFFSPGPDGGSPVFLYQAACNPPGALASGTGSFLTVSGLSNGVAYNCTLTATNALGSASTTFAGTPSSSAPAFSIEGIQIPSPSKIAGQPGVVHAGLNGAGSTINAWAVDPASCTGGPLVVSKAWRHNLAYDSFGSIDMVEMGASERLTYRFVAGAPGLGQILFGESTTAMNFGVSMNVSRKPCDFDFTPERPDPIAPACRKGNYVTGAILLSVSESAPGSFLSCGLVPGEVYFLNIGIASDCPGMCGGVLQLLMPIAPVINALSASAGPAGTNITISGTGLAAASVTIGGVAASVITPGENQIVVAVPAAAPAGLGLLVVTATSTTTASRPFTVLAPPSAPAITSAIPGDTSATIVFSSPASSGGLPITAYMVDCGAGTSPVTGPSSPITVGGLLNDTAYACTVSAISAVGTGAASAPVSVTPSATAPLILAGAQSRKIHGGNKTFNLPIDVSQSIAGNVTVEPRLTGSGHTIVFQFNRPIANSGLATASTGTASAAASGNEVIVFLSDIPDRQRVTVSLSGVNGDLSAQLSLGFLAGDANRMGSVTAADKLAVKSRIGNALDNSNFWLDLDLSGDIGQADVSIVRSRSGAKLP